MRNTRSSLKRRRRPDPMRAYDDLPAPLRAWLSTAVLPWSPQSALRIWRKAIQGDQGTPVSRRPKLSRDEVTAYAAKLSELAKWSADQGVVLSYHHHMGAMVQDSEDIDWLMEGSSKELTLLYDTGHLHFAGADPLAVLDRWGHRVQHVHFKDVRQPVLDWVRAEDKSFLDGVAAGVYSVPGDPDGCIDFRAITDRLKAIDYSGWIVVEAEQDPAKAPPYEYAKLGYDHIIDICGRSGLTIG